MNKQLTIKLNPSINFADLAKKATLEKREKVNISKKMKTTANGAQILLSYPFLKSLLETEEAMAYFLSVKLEKRPNFYLYVIGNKSETEIEGEGFFKKYVKALRDIENQDGIPPSALSFRAMMLAFSSAISHNGIFGNPIIVLSCVPDYLHETVKEALKRIKAMVRLPTRTTHTVEQQTVKSYKTYAKIDDDGKLITYTKPEETVVEMHNIDIFNYKEPKDEDDHFMTDLPNEFFSLVMKNVTLSVEQKKSISILIEGTIWDYYGVDKEKEKLSLGSLRSRFYGIVSKYKIFEEPKFNMAILNDIKVEDKNLSNPGMQFSKPAQKPQIVKSNLPPAFSDGDSKNLESIRNMLSAGRFKESAYIFTIKKVADAKWEPLELPVDTVLEQSILKGFERLVQDGGLIYSGLKTSTAVSVTSGVSNTWFKHSTQ